MAFVSMLEMRVHHFDEVSSTNDIVRDAVKRGEAAGFVACARTQTGGYGRRGNTWVSPEGGLYASFLLKPTKIDSELATLGMVAALAVCQTLERFVDATTAARIQVKWPNDVVIAETALASRCFLKICGISTEKIGSSVCLGIGVNIIRPQSDGSSQSCLVDACSFGGRNEAVFLSDLRSTLPAEPIEAIMATLCDEFSCVYALWEQRSFAAIAPQFNGRSILTGRRVEIAARTSSAGEGTWRGVVDGIDDTGALVLVDETSEKMLRIIEGTVTLL